MYFLAKMKLIAHMLLYRGDVLSKVVTTNINTYSGHRLLKFLAIMRTWKETFRFRQGPCVVKLIGSRRPSTLTSINAAMLVQQIPYVMELVQPSQVP